MAKSSKLRLVALGGLHELGKNMWVYEAPSSEDTKNTNEYLVVDAGISYPGREAPGIDYVLPEYQYIKENEDRIQALVLTSVHESHSGGAHHLLNKCSINKVIGSKLAIAATKYRLDDKRVNEIEWIEFESRANIQAGKFTITPLRVTSCSKESYACIITANGNQVFYSGTYKIEQTPTDRVHTDLAGITAISTPKPKDNFRPIDLYLGDSANVEIEGYSTSEMVLLDKFRSLLKSNKARVIINTYSSNTIRIENIFKLALELGRKVALHGQEAKEAVEIAQSAGLLDFPEDLFINIQEINNFPREETLVLCTAPEHEAVRELEDLAYNRSLELQLEKGDVVINSADLPPGTVRVMAEISDEFFLKGITMIGGRNAGVQAHSHALTEEMSFMFNLVRPKAFVPAMGETRHLVRHAKLAVQTGFSAGSILMLENGDMIEIENGEFCVIGHIKTDEILFNHKQDFHVEDKIIKERDSLSTEGVVIVSFSMNKKKKIISGPVFTAKACTFSKNKEWRAFCAMNTPAIVDAVDNLSKRKENANIEEYQATVREHMNKAIKQQIGKKPTVMVFANET